MNSGFLRSLSGSPGGSRAGLMGVYKVVLFYAGLASLWVFVTDRWVGRLGVSVETVAWWSTAKGWLFVGLTSVLLLLALRQLVGEIDAGRVTLARSEARFRTLVEAASDAIVIENNGRFAYVNPAGLRLFGALRPEELLGTEVVERVGAEGQTRTRDHLRQVRERGAGAPLIEVVVLRLDGTRVPVELGVAPFVLEGEAGTLLLVRDITERKRMESALRESEATFATFMAHLPGFASIKGADRRIVFMNASFEQYLGLRPGQALGRPVEEYLPAAVAAQLRADDERVLRERIPLVREETFDGPKGARTFLTTRFLIPRADGREGLGSITLDITDRKHAEESLQELTGRLFSLQDEERRRLARELHDTTAQDLTAIGLGMSRVLQLLNTGAAESARTMVADCMRLVDMSGDNVRTLSYLLHPPLLDELGLPAALRDFAEELERRTGVPVELECEEGFGRLSSEREMALFRIAQESVADTRRRSSLTRLRLELRHDRGAARMEIGLWGGPETAGALAGEPESVAEDAVAFGILGMRERVRHLGGELEVVRHLDRVLVCAKLPSDGVSQPGGGSG